MKRLLFLAMLAVPVAASANIGPIDELERQVAQDRAMVMQVSLSPAPQLGGVSDAGVCMKPFAFAETAITTVEDMLAQLCVDE